MTLVSLFPVFVVGLLGSVHCVGMCGGIVSAFSMAPSPSPSRAFPVAVATVRAPAAGNAARVLALTLAYNSGRIASYMTAGALAGGLAAGARTLAGLGSLQSIGYWLANLMLVALGLYLMDAWRGLDRLEVAGQQLWRHVRPLMTHLLPLDSVFKMFALGGLWGWLPCGMVYSVLLTAMLSGSAASGAALMLAFGLGTLPMLLAIGLMGARLRAGLQRRPLRIGAGLLVLAFGLLGLVRAAAGPHGGWLESLCLAGAPP